MNADVQGLRGLSETLSQIRTTGFRQVARATMTGTVVPLKKAIRRGVNRTKTTTAVKRAARQTIGSSVNRNKDGTYGAKAGLGVGKPTKRKRVASHERSVYGQRGAKLAAGVGLSAANIHWFVLGTKQRKQKTTGREVGRINPIFSGVVPAAVSASRGEMVSEAAKRAAIALQKAVIKARNRR